MRKYLAMLVLVIVAVSVASAANTVQMKKVDAIPGMGKLTTTIAWNCSSNFPPAGQAYLLVGQITTAVNKPVPYQWVKIGILCYDARSKSWKPYPGRNLYTRTNKNGFFSKTFISPKPAIFRYNAMLLGYPLYANSPYMTSTSSNQDVYVVPAVP